MRRIPLALVDDMPSRDEVDRARDFGEIAELHRPLLLSRALRLSGNEDVAQELVQETLFRGLRKFDQLQHRNAAGWLMTIMTNLFFDYLKHRRVATKAEPDLKALTAHELEGDALLLDVTDAELDAAMQLLDPELRELVELCYLKEMPYREVSAMLNLPTGTIGTRLMRARARLRQLLEPKKLRVVKP